MLSNKPEVLVKSGGFLSQDLVNQDIAMTAFMELNKTDQFILRKLKKVRRFNDFRFVVAAGVVYYILKSYNERLEKLEKEKEVTE